MTDRELMKEALEVLEDAADIMEVEGYYPGCQQEVIDALRDRLAQPEKEKNL
jgi:hypothetical protein